MKFLPLTALVTLAAFAVTCISATSGPDPQAIPRLGVDLQDPLMLPFIAGPSNQHFDLGNTTSYADSSTESAPVPTSSVLPFDGEVDSETTPTCDANGEPMPTENPGSSQYTDADDENTEPHPPEELKAEFEWPDICTTHNRPCLPIWTRPFKRCCPGLTCWPSGNGILGRCLRRPGWPPLEGKPEEGSQ